MKSNKIVNYDEKNREKVKKEDSKSQEAPESIIIKSRKKNVKNKKREPKRGGKVAFLFFLGGIIGVINGFFGGGGGMVCVPVLENFLKYPEKEAHATAISIIFPLSLLSATIYVFNGKVQSLPLCLIGVGVLIGGVLGSFLLKILPAKLVGIIFSILMIFAGVRMIIWHIFYIFYLD